MDEAASRVTRFKKMDCTVIRSGTFKCNRSRCPTMIRPRRKGVGISSSFRESVAMRFQQGWFEIDPRGRWR